VCCVLKARVLWASKRVLESGYFFFCGEGPRSRSYGRTAALRLIMQLYDEDEEKDDQFLLFFKVMEHRWNEIDRERPKYSGKNLN
jgi:hypothetical protein